MLEIQRLYWTDQQRMEALVDDYITHIPLHPYLEGVCCCTKKMEQHKQADEVTTKYVKGLDVNPCLILIQAANDLLYIIIIVVLDLNIKVISVI